MAVSSTYWQEKKEFREALYVGRGSLVRKGKKAEGLVRCQRIIGSRSYSPRPVLDKTSGNPLDRDWGAEADEGEGPDRGQ